MHDGWLSKEGDQDSCLNALGLERDASLGGLSDALLVFLGVFANEQGRLPRRLKAKGGFKLGQFAQRLFLYSCVTPNLANILPDLV